MYDVKQADPAEWASPPWEARLIDKPEVGKVLMGRGAVNQKGPQASMLAALHAIRGAGRKIPVNLVLVAEGEEEIGSPNFPQIVRKPEVQSALSKCSGIFMPSAAQGAGWRGHGQPWRERRDRMRADFDRREMGTGPAQGHSFFEQGPARQPGLASGSGAQHARLGRMETIRPSRGLRTRRCRSVPSTRR